MQTQRLFEIIYILLRKKRITAKELAEHFEVSTRTIYRDLDALTLAGIPLYTNKGTGGGIFLMEDFTLSNSLLSEEEKQHVLSALQSYHIAKQDDITPLLDKLSAQFRKDQIKWIDVDFNDWSGETQTTKTFQTLKEAIFEKKTISFTYYNSYGQMKERHVEPFRLLFKGAAWYLIGYCLEHNEQRMFKLYRMENVQKETSECTHTIHEEEITKSYQYEQKDMISITAHVDASLAFRLYDEYTNENYEKMEDGSFLLKIAFPPGEWVYSYLMGFGPGLEVLAPLDLREEMKRRYQLALQTYEENDHEC